MSSMIVADLVLADCARWKAFMRGSSVSILAILSLAYDDILEVTIDFSDGRPLSINTVSLHVVSQTSSSFLTIL